MAEATQRIQEFTEAVKQMPEETQQLAKRYLRTMIDKVSQEPQAKLRKVNETFSYPSRGGKNDGNPALMAILEMIPCRKLVVKENEYTRQRAIWLCHDFTVTWSPKKAQHILQAAFEQLR
jgi:hypothetical protein